MGNPWFWSWVFTGKVTHPEDEGTVLEIPDDMKEYAPYALAMMAASAAFIFTDEKVIKAIAEAIPEDISAVGV